MLLGLFLYAYRRPFLSPFFWKVGWVVSMYFLGAGVLLGVERYSPFFLNHFVVVLPEYIAVFLYAFRSPTLWQTREPAAASESSPNEGEEQEAPSQRRSFAEDSS